MKNCHGIVSEKLDYYINNIAIKGYYAFKFRIFKKLTMKSQFALKALMGLVSLSPSARAGYDWSELVNMVDYNDDYRVLDCF